jgi:hypothetical protein
MTSPGVNQRDGRTCARARGRTGQNDVAKHKCRKGRDVIDQLANTEDYPAGAIALAVSLLTRVVGLISAT